MSITESSNRWVFTSWRRPNIQKMELVSFLVYQQETTQNDTIHYQGYVEFKRGYKLNQVKSLFKDKTIYVDQAKKSREMNMMYCLKPKTATGSRYMYHPAAGESYVEEHYQQLHTDGEEDEEEIPDEVKEEAYQNYILHASKSRGLRGLQALVGEN